MDPERRRQLSSLEVALGYSFANPRLLDVALTHKSFVEETRAAGEANPAAGIEHYETLEFLGDAVLQLGVTTMILNRFPMAGEGVLSKLRSEWVSENSLYGLSRAYDLGQYLTLGKGEEVTQGREKKSILADVYESILGAVYRDGSFGEAFQIVRRDFSSRLDDLPDDLQVEAFTRDFKSLLQEYSQKSWKTIPAYVTAGEWGPDHDKTFRIRVMVNGELLGEGEGKSKKAAEQCAAEEALSRLPEADQGE
ncbi:MAG: ribonuclease III [Nitrospirae bacterium]|nr:ribonuclease III [Nitrospirota bacterium]